MSNWPNINLKKIKINRSLMGLLVSRFVRTNKSNRNAKFWDQSINSAIRKLLKFYSINWYPKFFYRITNGKLEKALRKSRKRACLGCWWWEGLKIDLEFDFYFGFSIEWKIPNIIIKKEVTRRTLSQRIEKCERNLNLENKLILNNNLRKKRNKKK